MNPTADLTATRIVRRLRAAGIATARHSEIVTGRIPAPHVDPFASYPLVSRTVVELADLDDTAAAAAHLRAAGFDVTTPAELAGALAVELRPGAEIAPDLDAAPVVEAEAAPAVLVVIPCGLRKLDTAAPAGDLYTGTDHRAAREAADALADRIPSGARVVILSALHGLLDLRDVVAPYDVTFPRHMPALAGLDARGCVTVRQIARQLAETGARSVVALTPNRYTERLRHACRTVGAELVEPLAGCRGNGDQKRRAAEIRDGGPLADAIADAIAGPVVLADVEPAAPVVEHLDDAAGQLALFAA